MPLTSRGLYRRDGSIRKPWFGSARLALLMAEIIQHRKNWAPWWALFFGLAALFSNAGFFIAIPGQQVIPWLSLAFAILALILLAIGLKRAFAQPEVYG